jgi:hypothetical protein
VVAGVGKSVGGGIWVAEVVALKEGVGEGLLSPGETRVERSSPVGVLAGASKPGAGEQLHRVIASQRQRTAISVDFTSRIDGCQSPLLFR